MVKKTLIHIREDTYSGKHAPATTCKERLELVKEESE
jgi:hypothetical protein